ncbi:homogentisate 1,2-dioxygenase [Sandarakinorhabdus rubra]|uniref:homogentisate 1,2-dioxygenase n=1 Tax=Sandarakinorhabdus rubra TaxID=2672568 RepID=UPI0013DC9B33|nr:homogentisate 1,2-dioxygenase [Sandarakinorhabdus rubra]
MTVRMMLAAMALLAAGAAQTQMAQPACASVSDANLPPDLKAWAGPRAALAAAASSTDLPALPIGAPVALTLAPAARVTFARPPEQQRTPDDAHAGLVAVTLPAAGVWRLSFSKPVWVDMLQDGKFIASGAHGALAPCTSVRKVVEFAAGPGRYTVQLSGNPGRDLVIMVTAKP